MVSVKGHRDKRQRDRLIDTHTQLNTNYDLGMISYVRMFLWGKAASEPITQSFLQAKADGKQTVRAS